MVTALFALTAGIGFILLGRWIYRHPAALYVKSIHASPDVPSLRIGAKAFGTLAIFVGAYAVAARAAGFWTHSTVAVIVLGLTIGILSAWFLRPPSKSSTILTVGQKLSTSPRAKVLVAVLLGLGVLFTVIVTVLTELGHGALIRVASMIAGAVSVAVIAAILSLPKRAS